MWLVVVVSFVVCALCDFRFECYENKLRHGYFWGGETRRFVCVYRSCVVHEAGGCANGCTFGYLFGDDWFAGSFVLGVVLVVCYGWDFEGYVLCRLYM